MTLFFWGAMLHWQCEEIHTCPVKEKRTERYRNVYVEETRILAPKVPDSISKGLPREDRYT